jgi:hypothetical protein
MHVPLGDNAAAFGEVNTYPRSHEPDGNRSKVTELASGQINGRDQITIELTETADTPAVVIVTWPAKPTVLHPHRFPTDADVCARTFAAAAVRLTAIKRERRL